MSKPQVVRPTRPRLGTAEHWVDLLLTEIFSHTEHDPRGYTLRDLAEDSGVCLSTVYRLQNRESPNVRGRTLWKLCKPLGLNLKTFREKGESLYHKRVKGKRGKAKVRAA